MSETPALDFEDVAAGRRLPPLTVHLTLHRLVLHAGANRDLTALHYDDDAARAAGARGAFINNVFALGLWERAVRDFAGPGAVVHAIRDLRMSAFNVVGDTLTVRGEVTRAWDDDGVGFAEITVETRNETLDRVTVGPGTVLVSLPRRGAVTDAASLAARYQAAGALTSGAVVPATLPADRPDPLWDDVSAFTGKNLLRVPSLDGADRVEASVVRRLCEPIELASALHHDPGTARAWGYPATVAPVFGLGTVYPDPGSWRPGEPTNYPAADRDAAPARPAGIETGEHCVRLPFPAASVAVLTSVGVVLDAPILVGDLLSVRAVRLTSVVPKRTSVGDGAFCTFVNDVWNETRRVGQVTKVQYQYVPYDQIDRAVPRDG